jgi:integrase/recombinase XerD
MIGTEQRYAIDVAEAKRLWTAYLDALAGKDRVVRPSVNATLRKFLSELTDAGAPGRFVIDKQRVLQWMIDDAKGRALRYVADRLAALNDFLRVLVEAGLIDASPLAEIRKCFGRPGWPRLAEALQSDDPVMNIANLQTASLHPGPLDTHIGLYLDLHRSLGKKFRTHATALRSLDRFLQGRASSPPAIERAMIEQWLAGLACGAYTRARKAQIIHRFFEHLRSQSVVSHNPAPLTDRLPASSFRPFIFTKEQLTAILEAAKHMPDRCRAPHTYFTMLALLSTLGLRLGEVRRLRLRDVDLDRQALFIDQTKFHKSRYVPFGPKVAECLKRYLETRRTVLLPVNEDDPVFTTKWRKPVYPRTLMVAFRKVLRTLGITGIPGQNPPRLHDLRHTFAVHRLLRWYREGIDVQSVGNLLRAYRTSFHRGLFDDHRGTLAASQRPISPAFWTTIR